MSLTKEKIFRLRSILGPSRMLLHAASILSIALIFSCGSASPKETNQSVETTIPLQNSSKDITTVDFAGLEPYLNLNDDSLRVFNFWATWCKPCVEELPLFEELAGEFNQTAFKLYYVSLDFPNQVEKKLKPFLKEHRLSGEVILFDDPDANSWIDKINPEWSGAIPATVITKKGQHQFHEGKFSTLSEIKELIHPIN